MSAKAALLSGPPGIGKTTSVRVIAKQLNLHLVEWNASDIRSKSAIDLGVSHLKDNTTIQSQLSSGTLILMDEVDGMSGSDKGGSKALIDMIKLTKVPIVCICNDRYNQKIRSLSNHCLELQFRKPDEKQVYELLVSICQKENIPFDSQQLKKRIQECQCDIRQLIGLLQVTKGQGMNKPIGGKDDAVVINIFDATRTLLNYDPEASIRSLLDMYFIDHSIIPLLYQHNYLYMTNSIEDVSQAANSIAQADIMTSRLRRYNDWSLMPQIGFLGTVYPTQQLKKSSKRKVEFTQHLGISSKTIRRSERLLKEFADCLSSVTFKLSEQAVKYGVLEVMVQTIFRQVKDKQYGLVTHKHKNQAVHFLKEHNLTLTMAYENMMELLCQFPKINQMKQLDKQVKTLLTKAYNQTLDSAELGVQKKRVVSAAPETLKNPDDEQPNDPDFEIELDQDEQDEQVESSSQESNPIEKKVIKKAPKKKARK